MNQHASVLGFHEPGDGWLFRLPVGWKYLLLLVLTFTAVLGNRWWLTLGLVVTCLALLASAGIGPRRALRVGWVMWSLLAVVCAIHLFSRAWETAVTSPGNILVAVLAARILTLTTPTPVLTDAIEMALRPLRWVGGRPDVIALAVSLMVRSIPYLLGSVDDARDAARARGMERRPHRLLVPVVLGAVAYADRTGEAMQARGLGERAAARPQERRGH